ncbi:MAG: hypothetical protein CL661_05710 [Bacteroidetes bacterium]|nr:hypothetical protein [Bacteroidota bacterium]
MKKTIFMISILILAITYSVQGQLENNMQCLEGKEFLGQTKVKKQESTNLVLKRNILKWNITPMIWNYRNINISYERVTSNHRSFSVNAGFFVLPSISLADSFNIQKNKKNWGFTNLVINDSILKSEIQV